MRYRAHKSGLALVLALFAPCATAQTNTLPASGNVGIGKTPAFRFDIAGAGGGAVTARLTDDYSIVRLNGVDLLGYAYQDLWTIGNSAAVGLVIGTTWNWDNQVSIRYTPGTIGAAGGVMSIGQATGDRNSSTYTHGVTKFFTNGLERLRIDAAGNVGIGTGNPGSKLDITGPTDSYASGIGFSPTGTGARNYRTYISISGSFVFNDATAGASRFSIDSSGNFGVGTTTPSHKLSVNGSVRAKEVIVDTGWSDYVFADTYQLAPLREVEEHIKSERHLPGIPSAAEVAANGVSLGEMQSKLLAKIEELTLHLIAQEKELKLQRAEIGDLRSRISDQIQPPR